MNALARALRRESFPPAPNQDDAVWTFSLSGYDTAGHARRTLPTRAIVVRVAGQIVDLDDLAARLSVSPNSPIETVVAAAFEQWGAEMFGRLRGSFAVAVVDTAAREVLVARDHTGCQPLFYARHGDAVSFAASTSALRAVPGVSGAFNRVALADALCPRYPDPGETFFEAIRRVPPGAFIRVAGGSLTVHSYWTPIGDGEEDPESRYAGDRFLALQRQAVRRSMEQQPSAIFLSGGLDSVSIALVASDLARASQGAVPIGLSLVYPGECSERDVQVGVAGALAMPQRLMEFDETVGTENLITQALRLNQHLSSPLQAFGMPAYVALARAGRALGATSIMTGTGGDEWLSASPYVLADLLRQGRLVEAARFVRSWSRSEVGRGLIWRAGLRPLAGSLAARLAPGAWDRRRSRRLASSDPAWIAPDPAVRSEQRARAHAALGAARPGRGFAALEMSVNLGSTATLQEKEEFVELGRAVGVQFRHPYYDPDLVEFLCQAPISVLTTGGWLKGLVRSQLAQRLPGLGFERQRKLLGTGFFRNTLERARRGLGPSDFRVPLLSELGVVSADGIARLAAQPGHAAESRLWNVLNTEAWLRYQL